MRYLSIDENCGDNLGCDCSILSSWNVFGQLFKSRTDNSIEEVLLEVKAKSSWYLLLLCSICFSNKFNYKCGQSKILYSISK
jgi:hypothetical protein